MGYASHPTVSSLTELQKRWSDEILPRFHDFFAILQDKGNTIPQEYLFTYYKDANNERRRNPLLRFLRDYTALEIIDLLDKAPKKAKESALKNIIRPYFKLWNDLFDALKCFYADPSPVVGLRNLFDALVNDCGGLEHAGIDHRHLISRSNAYSNRYEQFCQRFAELPTSGQPNTQFLSAIKKAIEDAIKMKSKTFSGVIRHAAVAAARKTREDGDNQTLGNRPGHGGRPGYKGDEELCIKTVLNKVRKNNWRGCSQIVAAFYSNKSLWIQHGWMTKEGVRKIFCRKSGEVSDEKARKRLYAAVMHRK